MSGDDALNMENDNATENGGPRVLTFGCRLNSYESEVMRSHACDAGLDDVIFVNTCAVTGEAERQARQSIRRLRRDNPTARIVVTGCAAQISPDRYAAMPEVDRVLGNAEKMEAESYRLLKADPGSHRILVTDIMEARETAGHLITGFEGRARAFVEIQQGCNHRCTFCIIPFGRGPNRSVPMGHIVSQVRSLVTEHGFAEIVLTGVDIASYGGDLPGGPTLGQMMRRLLAQVPELGRLRLSSLDPIEVNDDLLHLVENEPRLMPHFHLSIQAGDDMVLKRMKRRHNRADVLRLVERLRRIRPDAAFGADIIAGFPTETEEMFGNTLDLVTETDMTHLHVFPYSIRPGTPAARMPQVEGSAIRERAARLRAVGEAAMERFMRTRIGTLAQVLIERGHDGLCERYLPVRLDGNEAPPPPGAVIPVRITGISNGTLTAKRYDRGSDEPQRHSAA